MEHESAENTLDASVSQAEFFCKGQYHPQVNFLGLESQEMYGQEYGASDYSCHGRVEERKYLAGLRYDQTLCC